MRTWIRALLTAAISLSWSVGANAQSYTLTDLSQGQASGSDAFAINDQGQTVGAWVTSTFSGVVLWATNGGVTATDIGSGLSPFYINSSGQIAGDSGDIVIHASFLYSGGTLSMLAPFADGYQNHVWGLNANGQVVGRSASPVALNTKGFLWNGSTVTWFGDQTTAFAINDLGHVLVVSQDVFKVVIFDQNFVPSFLPMFQGLPVEVRDHSLNNQDEVAGDVPGRALYFSAATGYIIAAEPIAGDIGVQVTGINNAGQIFGLSYGSADHPFIWSKSTGLVVPALPADVLTADIYGYNDNGECVGNMDSQTTGNRAWVYRPDKGLEDLNDLIPAGSGLTLTRANGINNLGQIVALALDTLGNEHGVLLTPAKPNSPPVAAPQSVSLNEDASVAITLAATDADGDPLTYSVVTSPIHGTLSGVAPNVAYTPFANYNGPDSFSFVANDGAVDSNVAAVSITVIPVNDPPVAQNGAIVTNEDTPVNITLVASDIDGDPLSYILVSGPAHGTLSGVGANRNYTPLPNYNGSDSFTFKANDGTADSNIATVSITVIPVNDPPVAVDDSAITSIGNTVTIDVLANDSDVDGDTLTVTAVTIPAHGKVVINAGGTVSYTPSGRYSGPDSFTYTISDGNGGTAAAAVSVQVVAGNAPPRAVSDRTVTTAGVAITVNVLANDSDPDGDPLTVIAITQPGNGTTVLNANDTVTYTPAPGFTGHDSFTYTVSDGKGGTAVGTVKVRVTK